MRQAYRWDARGALFFGLYNGMTLSYLAFVAAQLGFAPALIGLIVAAPTIRLLATSWSAAHPSHEHSVMAVVRPAIVARTIMALIAFTADHPLLYLAVLMIAYLVDSFTLPAYAHVVQAAYLEEHRPQALGFINGIQNFGLVLGSTLVGVLLDHLGVLGFRVLFPAGALAGIISALFFSRIRLTGAHHTVSPVPIRQAFRSVWRSRALRRFTLLLFFAGVANLIAVPLFPLYQVEVLHLPNTIIGCLIALNGVCCIVAPFLWSKVISRCGPFRSIQLVVLIVPFIPFCYAAASTLAPVVVATFLGGLAWIGWDLSWQNYLYARVKRHLSGAFAVQYTLLGLRGLVAPQLGVALAGFTDMRTVFLLSGGLLVVGAALFLLMKPGHTPDHLDEDAVLT